MRNLPLIPCLLLLTSAWFPSCAQAPSGARDTDQSALAVVEGNPITEADLDIRGELLQLEQQRYEITSRALDEEIGDRLLKAEADRRGVSLEELLENEVNAKVEDPTDLEIEAFYERQKQRIRRPLDEIRPQIAEALKSMKAAQIRSDLVAELRGKSDVEVRLDPPRVPIDLSQAPQRGPEDAPVTIVEFSDFQCPFCKRVQPVIQQIRERYPEQVSWRFKDLPLNNIHPSAQKAAEAARCAGEQDKFWEYRDALFDADQITMDMHKGVAESLGLETEPFLQCLSSGKYGGAVEADSLEAQSLGIGGTPTFVINGIVLSGALPLEEFTRVIESELEKKGETSPVTP